MPKIVGMIGSWPLPSSTLPRGMTACSDSTQQRKGSCLTVTLMFNPFTPEIKKYILLTYYWEYV